MDNILHYASKELTSTLGRTDPLVAFFPSFFFTKLYREGLKDPNRSDTHSYAGIASWTKKLQRETPISQTKTIVFLYNKGHMHWKMFCHLHGPENHSDL
jgi:Ulp1 family protease